MDKLMVLLMGRTLNDYPMTIGALLGLIVGLFLIAGLLIFGTTYG